MTKAQASDQPRQERAERSRREILKAARNAFARSGYEGANIRDIAESVGVTHTLIRYHFGNKHDLWKAVVDDMFDRLSASLSAKSTGKIDLTARDGLKQWLRFYIRYCAENPEHVRIMLHESMSRSERLDYMAKRIRRSHTRLIPVFQRLMNDGVVPEAWLVSFFYIVSSVCQMPFVLSRAIQELYEVDMTSDEAIEAHSEAVLALLLGERSADPSRWPTLPEWAASAQKIAVEASADPA
jgi:AcrR family transcriptional regulator